MGRVVLHKKVKPIIETNKMGMPFGLSPGPFCGRAGSSSSKRQRKYILICPNCKAVIGSK